MKSTTATIVALCATAITPMIARADVFTDSAAFHAAAPGLNQIDFEGVVGPDDSFFDARELYASEGVVFSHPAFPTNGEIQVFGSNIFAFDGSPGASPSSIFGSSLFGALILMEFTDSVNAFGFNVSSMDFAVFPFGISEVQVDVYNDATLLASATINPTDITDFSSFIGFSNLGADITSVEFSTSSDAIMFIDNLSFGTVPTPGSLIILGLGGIVSARRRR